MAYFEAVPNFRFSGRWFSKLRYAVLTYETGHKGRMVKRVLCRVDPDSFKRVKAEVVDPAKEPEDCADPVDWSKLQAVYEAAQAKYTKVNPRHRSYLMSKSYDSVGWSDAEKRQRNMQKVVEMDASHAEERDRLVYWQRH